VADSPAQAGRYRSVAPSEVPPLPAPPDNAVSYAYKTDLYMVRTMVLKHAREAGLPEVRVGDLVLAVSEVAANTLRHTRSSGMLTIWSGAGEIVCEIRDQGTITDPLAGRRIPAPGTHGGQGLWLVHQVCDLIELRSGDDGTTVRMHMTLGTAQPRK
jgi:anti-sigma regulatory factor (Ser/Thr protein kinase)